MSTRLIADLVRIREVLQTNGVDDVVDEDMVMALLELYQADDQRVDLVVLDLEGMIGKQLSVGAQQKRWNELQTGVTSPNAITVEYENIQKHYDISVDTVVNRKSNTQTTVTVETVHQVVQKTSPSTSAEATGKGKKSVPSQSTVTVKTQQKVIEKTTTSTSAVVVENGKETVRSKANEGTNTGNVKETPPAVKITTPTTQTKRINESKALKRPHSSVAQNITKAVADNNQVNQPSSSKAAVLTNNTKNDLTHLPKESPTKRFKMSAEATSIAYHKTLLSTFPRVHVKYAAFVVTEFTSLDRACDEWNDFLLKSLANIDAVPKAGTLWNLPQGMNPEHERLCLHVYDTYLNDQLDFLVRTAPHVDPTFLEEEVKTFQGDQEKIRDLVTSILEGTKTFPSRADYNKRKAYNELANKFFTVEEFLELYDDPVKHFKDDARVTDDAYREQAFNQLKIDFRLVTVYHIKRVFTSCKSHYTPAYLTIEADKFLHTMKAKRGITEYMKTKTKDLFLLQEVAFVRLLPDLKNYLKTKEKARIDAVTIAKKNGTLLDCPICCEDELVEQDLVHCPNGHGVCRTCVRRQTEELIGLMKNHVPCLSPNCPTEYSVGTIKEVLKKSVFLRFEKRRQAEEITAAGIEGLESCPFCDYCEVPNENDSLFQCKFPECLQISCRQCREPNHLPLRCEEFAMKQRLNNYVETKMTEALLRQCPSCKKNFVKADGCNKMVCVCGAIMCYLCRKQIKDYNHFENRNPNDPSKGNGSKCTLYSDTNKLHEEEVARSAQKARAELAASNPNIRVDLVVGKK